MNMTSSIRNGFNGRQLKSGCYLKSLSQYVLAQDSTESEKRI